MKDPYQSAKNPYEILEVPHNAKDEDIDLAFKKAIAGKNRNHAANARMKLKNGIDRAWEDFFMYDIEAVETIIQKEQFLELLKSARSSLADKCKSIQTDLFPEVGTITHVLALLWYWTAINEEEKCWAKYSANESSVLPEDINALENSWEKAIAHLIAVLNSSFYMVTWMKKRVYYDESKSKEFTKGLEDKVKSQLENSLQNYQDKYGTINKMLSQVFNKLLDKYALETSCAYKLRILGIEIETKKNGSVKVEGIGKIFIEEHGHSESIRKAITGSGLNGEKKKIASELLIVFSPHAHLLEKINKKQYQAALSEIDALSKTEKISPEIIDLTCEALKGVLRYSIQNKNIDELLDYINRYYKEPPSSFRGIVKAMADDIDTLIRDIKDANHDKALKILEWGHQNVPDHENIKFRLAEIYFTRGIKTYNKGFGKYQQDPSDKNIKEMEAGFEDVKKSLQLNPTKHTQEQYNIIKGYLDKIHGGGFFIQGPPIRNENEALRLNNEGVEILNGCQADYEKYINSDAIIKELSNLGPNQQLNDQGLKMMIDACQVIISLYDQLNNNINNALGKFNSANAKEPSNETFRKNKEIAEEMRKELERIYAPFKSTQSPKKKETKKASPNPPKNIKYQPKKGSPRWLKPILRIFLFIAFAFLTYLVISEFNVNKSLF